MSNALARPSRRALLCSVGAASFAAGVVASGAARAQTQTQSPAGGDSIYAGGPILTMNDARPTAEAVLVRAGRIVAVGTRAEVETHKQGNARLIDLQGRTLLPGFFDPHGHMVFVGLQALSANLLAAPDGEGSDIAALQRLLRDWVAKNGRTVERYKLILGFGYDDSQLKEQRHPTRDDLDKVSTELPVVAVHQSGHLGVANSKALEVAGITAATKDPVGGVFRRRDGSSEPNGVMEEHAFFIVIGALARRFDSDAAQQMIQAGAAFYARFGYTTAQDARAFGASVAHLEKAAEAGLLPIDVLCYPDIIDAVDSIQAPALSREYRGRFRVGGAKLTLDGSPQGKTAWLTRPYFVPPPGRGPDYVGYPAIPNDQAFAAVDLAFARGWQILCHCNGDAAADVFIAAVKQATAKHGPADRRPVLVHGQTLRADQLDSMRPLGILPSLFPMHTFYWGDWHRDSVLGPERAENISPTGWCLQRSMKFTSHHDAPVANPDSMRVLSATVTRRSRSGDIIGPMHRVPVDIALKAMTSWAAQQHFEEDRKGSLERGKLADFVVLSDNPLTVDPEKLAQLRISETIKEGRTVYRAS